MNLETFIEKLMERAEERQHKIEPLLGNFESALQVLANESDVIAPVYQLDQRVFCMHPLLAAYKALGVIEVIKFSKEGISYTLNLGKGFKHDFSEKELLKIN